MKRTAIVIVCILLAVLLLPVPMRLKDGGTIRYQAVLYSVSNVHRLAPSLSGGYEEGMIVEILGMQVFNNVRRSTETIRFHDRTLNRSDLSEETLEWLQWYNELEESEQLAISFIPKDLHELCGFGYAEDGIAEETGPTA